MSLTFTIIAVCYIAFVIMVLMTFSFLRDRNVKEKEYYPVNSILMEKSKHFEIATTQADHAMECA